MDGPPIRKTIKAANVILSTTKSRGVTASKTRRAIAIDSKRRSPKAQTTVDEMEEDEEGDNTGSANLVKKFFPGGLGEELALAAGGGKELKWRKVLETINPTGQCTAAGRGYKPNMPCYICGLGIPDKKTLKGTSDELYPECEHILPITEARWWGILYMGKGKDITERTRVGYNLEYDQAHRVCNQAKGAISLVRNIFNPGAPISVDEDNIKEMFKLINTRAKKDLGKYSGSPYANPNSIKRMKEIVDSTSSGVGARIAAVRDRVINLIAWISEESRPKVEGSGNMLLLLQTAEFGNPGELAPAIKDVYTAWYDKFRAGGEWSVQTTALKNIFIDSTLEEYPFYGAEQIQNTFGDKILLPAGVDRLPVNLTQGEIKDNIGAIYNAMSKGDLESIDPTGLTFIHFFEYKFYKDILEKLLRIIPPEDQIGKWLGTLCLIDQNLQLLRGTADGDLIFTSFGGWPDISPCGEATVAESKGRRPGTAITRAAEALAEEVRAQKEFEDEMAVEAAKVYNPAFNRPEEFAEDAYGGRRPLYVFNPKPQPPKRRTRRKKTHKH